MPAFISYLHSENLCLHVHFPFICSSICFSQIPNINIIFEADFTEIVEVQSLNYCRCPMGPFWFGITPLPLSSINCSWVLNGKHLAKLTTFYFLHTHCPHTHCLEVESARPIFPGPRTIAEGRHYKPGGEQLGLIPMRRPAPSLQQCIKLLWRVVPLLCLFPTSGKRRPQTASCVTAYPVHAFATAH